MDENFLVQFIDGSGKIEGDEYSELLRITDKKTNESAIWELRLPLKLSLKNLTFKASLHKFVR